MSNDLKQAIRTITDSAKNYSHVESTLALAIGKLVLLEYFLIYMETWSLIGCKICTMVINKCVCPATGLLYLTAPCFCFI